MIGGVSAGTQTNFHSPANCLPSLIAWRKCEDVLLGMGWCAFIMCSEILFSRTGEPHTAQGAWPQQEVIPPA